MFMIRGLVLIHQNGEQNYTLLGSCSLTPTLCYMNTGYAVTYFVNELFINYWTKLRNEGVCTGAIWNVEFWQKTFKLNLVKRQYLRLFHEFCQKTLKLNLAERRLSRKWPTRIGLDFGSSTWVGNEKGGCGGPLGLALTPLTTPFFTSNPSKRPKIKSYHRGPFST